MIIKLKNEGTGDTIELFSGVKGLISHGQQLKEFLNSRKPAVLLVSISPEEVQGLSDFLKNPFEMNLSDYEIIYGIRLSKYGEVMTPPPIYTEAMLYTESSGSGITGIDIPQSDFDRLYTETMKTRHLLRHSIRKKRVLNHDFHDTTEYEFAENWIKRINAVRGLATIDSERVNHMAKEINLYSEEHRLTDVVVVIDHEFYHPLIELLEKSGWTVIV